MANGVKIGQNWGENRAYGVQIWEMEQEYGECYENRADWERTSSAVTIERWDDNGADGVRIGENRVD